MRLPSLGLPIITLSLGVLGYAGFSGFHLVPKPPLPQNPPISGIDFADLSHVSIRSEQAFLEDSAPLFLATKWNAAHSPQTALGSDIVKIPIHPPELYAPTSSFFANGPELTFAKPPPSTILHEPNKPFNTLGLAKEWLVPESLSSKGGIMTVARVGTPTDAFTFSLPTTLLNKSKTGIWPPVEYFCTVENLTALGVPSQTKSSGSNDLDEALSDFARQIVSSSSLDNGYYRITASP